jgi:ribonuclease E
MFSPYVTLKSGGYLVINQTEALVAIDVNSGKATREFSIEETALNTNLEASDEIARQLKLRDLAGLIVIDFIDMEEKRNNRSVERRLKDALRFDRARIQLGRISHFGLMEMSRQRLRSGVLEGSTSQCPHCQGTGIIRSTESVALAVLRGLEDALMAGARTSLVATTTSSVAIYILNNKRHFINEMETRHGIFVSVQASDKLQGANFTIEKGHAPAQAVRRPARAAVNMDWGFEGEGEGEGAEPVEGEVESTESEVIFAGGDEARPRDEGRGGGEDGGRRRRRRRGRGSDRDRPRNGDRGIDQRSTFEAAGANGEPSEYPDAAGGMDVQAPDRGSDDEGGEREAFAGSSEGRQEEQGGRRRRRGRRGGRRGRDRGGRPPHEARQDGDASQDDFAEGSEAEPITRERAAEHDQLPVARAERKPNVTAAPERPVSAPPGSEPQPVVSGETAAEPPRARGRARNAATTGEPKIERVVVKPDQLEGSVATETGVLTSEPTRRGWWQRRLGSE